MEIDWGLGHEFNLESDSDIDSYHKEYQEALDFFEAHNIDLKGSGFLTRISEYGLEFEVLTLAHNWCKGLQEQLTPELICMQLNYAAMEWDV